MNRDSLLSMLSKKTGISLEELQAFGTKHENILASGIKTEELNFLKKLLKSKPLRHDEFVLFSTEILNVEKYDFKSQYSGLNMKEHDDDDSFPYMEYPPVVNVIVSAEVEVGFGYKKNGISEISVWVGDKKLGIVAERYVRLIDELIKELIISRVVLIGNEDSIPGYFDTYMKAVFIATNAPGKSAQFDKGRFVSLRLLTQEEMDEM
jgi:hypothetical protein